MRYQEGSVRVTGGSYVVLGTGTRFLQESLPVGSVLILDGFVGCSQIVKIISDVELHLSSPVRGLASGAVLSTDRYSISSDFTPTLTMPYPNRGETDNASLLLRAFEILDKAVPRP